LIPVLQSLPDDCGGTVTLRTRTYYTNCIKASIFQQLIPVFLCTVIAAGEISEAVEGRSDSNPIPMKTMAIDSPIL
jgi:hypothetical protein